MFLNNLILFANHVEGIDWAAEAGVAHWPVAKDKTVAPVGPVFALIKLRRKVSHQFQKIVISKIICQFFCQIFCQFFVNFFLTFFVLL